MNLPANVAPEPRRRAPTASRELQPEPVAAGLSLTRARPRSDPQVNFVLVGASRAQGLSAPKGNLNLVIIQCVDKELAC